MNLEALVNARTEQLRQAIAELERSYDITLGSLGRRTGSERRRNCRPFEKSYGLHH